MQRLRLLPIALLATLVAACGGGGGNAVAPEPPAPPAPQPPSPPPILPAVTTAWHAPSCGSVTGAPVTFTSDGGLTRAPIETPSASDYFTYGVAALEGGSTLAAIVGTRTPGSTAELYFSTDAGCSWQPSGQTFPYVDYYLNGRLSPAGAHAYVWGQAELVSVIAPTGIATPFSFESFPWWVSGPYGLGVDPSNPHRVRVSVYDCQHRGSCGIGSVIEETADAGATWTRVGVPAPSGTFEMFFSPINLDHVIAMSASSAAHVSWNGGHQWLAGQGVPADWYAEATAIGSDGQTVWLLSRAPPVTSRSGTLFVSHDGGLNYQEAFAATAEAPLFTAAPFESPLARPRLFAHPANADVVYVAYTDPAAATTYLYRYDAELDQLSQREWPAAEGGVWSLTFNPADADVIYLGLAAVQ